MATQTFKTALTTGMTAAVDLVKHRFVGFDGNYPSAGAVVYGVIQEDTAAGEMAPVDLYGELLVETAGAISQGGKVETDANGKAVAAMTGEVVGLAIDAAAGAGEIIRILRI